MAGPETSNITTNHHSKAAAGHRRFVGVRQRPSGRWVAEIKDSSQHVRLWLGTFDSPEEAARAYDEAARALRGDNARTNFLPGADCPNSDAGFASLRARLNKNLQSIMARTAGNGPSKTRVSDQFTFANMFHYRSAYSPQPCPVDTQRIESAVQPSFVVPRPAQESDSVGQRGDGEEELLQCGFGDEMGEWVDDEEAGSSSKRAKVSSSFIVPPFFNSSQFPGESL